MAISRARSRRRAAPTAWAVRTAIWLLAALPKAALADDLPPELLARFTRQIQPLVLARCAAGACHGGPRGHAPLLVRDPATAADTLANAATFRGLVGPDGDVGPLSRRLSVTHPAGTTSRTLVMTPLTPRERGLLEGWLVEAGRAGDRGTIADPAVAPAAFTMPAAAPRPNRLRVLLDTGLPPPPPRDQPREGGRTFTGIVDRRTAPAAAGVTPESDPPSPPPGTADSPPARPDAPSSPGPRARGSR